MDSIVVSCECGARVKMPSSVAGKRVRCPKCSGVLSVPESAAGSSPVNSDKSALKSFSPEPAKAAPVVAPTTKPCLYCGEPILLSAKKCKHCGEFIEENETTGSPAVPSRRGIAAAKQVAATPGDDPNPAEYFAAIVLAPIGLIIGGVWAAMKLPKAKKMLQVAAAMNVIYAVGGLLFWMYFVREDAPVGAVVDQGVLERNRQFGIPRESNEYGDERTQRPPPGQSAQRSGMPGGEVDLEGQPPIIQKAMRANVLISLDQGLGSGVVVQRNGDQALILTNHHVVDIAFARSQGVNSTPIKDIPKLKVLYFNQKTHDGTVTWLAPDGIDLAIVTATLPKEIEPAVWQGLPKVSVGQEVFAVGNPAGLGWTYTKGVVSQTRKHKYPPDRPTHEVPVIQTDASITFGNSGGGLYSSADGQLLGINSFISDPTRGAGLGFAIRATTLMDLKPEGLILPPPQAAK